MDLKPPMVAKFYHLVLVLLLNTFFMKTAVAQATPIPVKVGVVLDMDSDVGEMGLNCIKMALSDFYDRHAYYQTRLVLNNRDSKRDVVGAAAAALDLLKNVEVQAIIGPLSSVQANFMIYLGDKAQVPIITFSATSPSLLSIRSPYFVQAAVSDSSQVQTICAIVQAFGWREVVPYRSVIPSSATDDRITLELYKLMTMQTRVFIVHLPKDLGSRLFTKAHVPKTPEFDSFAIRYKKALQQNNPTASHLGLNIFGLWAYDSAVALALAVEKARVRNATYLKANISRISTDLEGFGISSMGTELIRALSSTTFRGVAGDFKLVDGQLQSPPDKIVNVIGLGARVVGYWTKENGIVRELNFTKSTTNKYSTSKSNIESIIWPEDRTSPPKGWVIPTSGKKLRIGVPTFI